MIKNANQNFPMMFYANKNVSFIFPLFKANKMDCSYSYDLSLLLLFTEVIAIIVVHNMIYWLIYIWIVLDMLHDSDDYFFHFCPTRTNNKLMQYYEKK